MKLSLTRAGSTVSAEPLAVAPALIGAPLASPGRRAVALGIDLAMVGLLSQFTAWGLALALLLLAWHVHQALAADGARPWLARGVAGVLAVAALAVAWTAVRPNTPDAWMAQSEDALERAERVLDPADADEAREAAAAAASAASGIAAVVGPSRAASVAAEVASALAAAVPASAPASATAELQKLVDELRHLRREHRPRSLADRIDAAVTEVGRGFGWGIVYFSLLPAFWQGRTVGKAVMKLRIVELSGRPLTPLRTLKRYGGYAAGLATGGLGFVQALWDPNRQCLHDKAAHTVVLDVRPRPADVTSVPAPASAAAPAPTPAPNQ